MIEKFGLVFLSVFFSILYWSIVLKIIVSWLLFLGLNIFRKIDDMVDPVTTLLFKPFRWARMGMFDFSPIFALICLEIIRGGLFDLLTKVF